MNKIAAVNEWPPAELFAISALGGAGGFGALRLVSEMLHKARPQKPFENKVNLMLPAPHYAPIKKQDTDQHVESMGFSSPKTAHEDYLPPAPMGSTGYIRSFLPLFAGLPAGFLGAKYLYDNYKSNDMQKQVDKTKQKYLSELAAASQHVKQSEEKTPHLDAFCEAVALELNKAAGYAQQ
jgi:hypothetical protein